MHVIRVPVPVRVVPAWPNQCEMRIRVSTLRPASLFFLRVAGARPVLLIGLQCHAG